MLLISKRILFITQLIALLALMISCRPSQYIIGQEDGWTMVGQTKVNHITETDIVKINTNDKFTALRIYVKIKDVDFKNTQIHLINGDILQPAMEAQIKSGERGRVIELAADGKQLDFVQFKYRARGAWFTRRAEVFIIGKKYNPNGQF